MTKFAFFRCIFSFLARVSAVRFFAVTLFWEGDGWPNGTLDGRKRGGWNGLSVKDSLSHP